MKRDRRLSRGSNSKAGKRLVFALGLALVLMMSLVPGIGSATESIGAVRCYVEKANIQGDPGDPAKDAADMANYELYETVEGDAPEYLKSKTLGRRFAHLVSTKQAEDGTTDAYYMRGEFTYVFDVFSELGEMTISGVTYKGGQPEQYHAAGKFEEQIIIPDLQNGLMPVNTNEAVPDAYCAGWALDERTGDKDLLTYTRVVTENMLPTETMPYEGLVFKLTATWFSGQDRCVLASWFAELPGEVGVPDLNRMNYNGKVYVNYPPTNYELSMPKGSKPSASSAPGLIYVTCIEPDPSKRYPEGNTWQFLYDRMSFALKIQTNCSVQIPGDSSVPYQHNLAGIDPGWTGETVVDGKKFTGWYVDGEWVCDSLAAVYMPPYDLTIEARWEAQ